MVYKTGKCFFMRLGKTTENEMFFFYLYNNGKYQNTKHSWAYNRQQLNFKSLFLNPIFPSTTRIYLQASLYSTLYNTQ